MTIDRRALAEQLRRILRELDRNGPAYESVAATLRRAAFTLEHLDDGDLIAA